MTWVSVIVLAVGLGALVAALLIARRRLVDLHNPEELWRTWVDHAASSEEQDTLHAHIIKHAHELVEEVRETQTYESWSASMHNLLAIYDSFHGVAPDAELKVERMLAHYLNDPTRTPPPRPIPPHVIDNARGPSIEERRRARQREQVANQYRGGS